MRPSPVYLVLILLLVLLSICLLYSKQILQPEGMYIDEFRNTEGSLTFTVRTVSYNGSYHPRNAGVIWITNSNNQFVKTIKIWAQSYRNTLVKWIASSGNNTTGAITGASLTSHQLHSITWNGKNYSNVTVPDGDYKVNVEFSEHNATTNNPGKYKFVTFTKGADAVDITPANETYFTDMHLVWSPTAPVNGTIAGTVKNASDQPISGALVTVGSLTATSTQNGSYSISLPAGTYNVSCSAANYQTQNLSNIVITSNQTTTTDFTLQPIPNGVISGTVTDAQSQPIAGAVITDGTLSATSSETGFYSIEAFPGTYNLTCTAVNYVTQEQNNIIVTSNQTSTVNFNLASVANGDIVTPVNNLALNQNFPNPFGQQTTIRYYLAKGVPVSLCIYNTKGQLVRTLSSGAKSSGWNEVIWDGTNNQGKKLSSGNYICRLYSSGITQTITISLKH